MVDFRARLSPEGRARLDAHREAVERCRSLPDKEFWEEIKRVHELCEEPRWPLGSPVYDAVLHRVLIPEAIRRGEGGEPAAGPGVSSAEELQRELNELAAAVEGASPWLAEYNGLGEARCPNGCGGWEFQRVDAIDLPHGPECPIGRLLVLYRRNLPLGADRLPRPEVRSR